MTHICVTGEFKYDVYDSNLWYVLSSKEVGNPLISFVMMDSFPSNKRPFCHLSYCFQAVISSYSTDDRYATDVHYMGGCVLGTGSYN